MDSADVPCPEPRSRRLGTTSSHGYRPRHGHDPRHLSHPWENRINATVIRRALYILVSFPLGIAIGYTTVKHPVIAFVLVVLAAIITGNYLVTRRIERRRDRTPEGHHDVDLSLLHTP